MPSSNSEQLRPASSTARASSGVRVGAGVGDGVGDGVGYGVLVVGAGDTVG